MSSAVAFKECRNRDLPHYRLEAPAWWKASQIGMLACTGTLCQTLPLVKEDWPRTKLHQGFCLFRLHWHPLRASTGFFSVLLWTSGIMSRPSSSWSSSTFQPLKEPLKQAMPWNYASIIFVLWPAEPMEAGMFIPGQGDVTGLLNIASSQHWNNCNGMQLFHHSGHSR